MKILADINDPEIVETLRDAGVVVLRTDTLYGVLAKADDEKAVERVYALKSRDVAKSPIVLIASLSQLFDVPSREELSYLNSVWPEKVSVILPSVHAPVWLRRDNGSVAYRMPADGNLRELLMKTGPLIAPSANPEGMPPANRVSEAEQYFGDKVDIYVDGGEVMDDTPSRLVKLHKDGKVETLR
ncbi:MAG TPA: L-threonylcarbamoyladenylate synthase [Candidatus Saccharimonadales bacterium]